VIHDQNLTFHRQPFSRGHRMNSLEGTTTASGVDSLK
jgi:hypothetical protein